MASETADTEIKGEIFSTTESYAGEPFTVVTDYTLPDHWHVYYENPGTVGLPMEVSLQAPKGFKVEGPFFPVPMKFESDLGVSYGYERPRAAFRVTPDSDAPDEAVFNVVSSMQMCRDGQCLFPQEVDLRIGLKKGDGKPVAGASGLVSGFVGMGGEAVAGAVSITGVTLEDDGKSIVLHAMVEPGFRLDKSSVYFFSSNGEVLPSLPQQVVPDKDGKGFSLKMGRNFNEDFLYPNKAASGDGGLPPLTRLKGVLAVNGSGLLVDEEVSTAGEMAASGFDVGEFALLAIFLFMGGLILNLMPCVFPVIGLKVLSFVEMGGGERRKVAGHSLAFVVGVLVSFWVVTGVLVLLKAGLAGTGRAVNWAFWMEQPWVIFCLLLLLLVLGLSMAGIFEIGVRATSVGGNLQGRKGKWGSFWSGVLATVIATPCSAPFLGSAMPSALALPSGWMFLAFTAMGLGMSCPYLLLSMFPSLLKFMPRPGAWMESFKQGLSFLMFGAAAWLLWVYAGFFDAGSGLLNVFVGVVVFSAGWWVYGRWCVMYKERKVRMAGFAAAVVLWAGGVWLMIPQGGGERSAWEPWSQALQERYLEEGRPVYVDFTAKWCLTCQVNKRVAYTDAVMKEFARSNTALLIADKTKGNEAIDKALKKLGRTSVPVNVLYVPGGKEPFITREVLTPDYLEAFVKEHLGGEGGGR